MKSVIRTAVFFLAFLFKTSAGGSQCITWFNNISPAERANSAMEFLCSKGIIANFQNATSVTGGLIQKVEIARCLGKAFFGPSTDPISFLDNFPSIFPYLTPLDISDQRYIKLMLFLEYADDIAPFSRNYYFSNFKSSIKRSEAVKAMLEAWNLKPYFFDCDPKSSAYSSFVCDMKVSNRNLPWIERAIPLGLFTSIVQNCGTSGILFGADNDMPYGEFYTLLARLLSPSIPTPNITYADFLSPIYSI